MSVEIIIGPNQKKNMSIRKGEKCEEAAKIFAEKYRLDKGTEKLLIKLLEREIEKTTSVAI